MRFKILAKKNINRGVLIRFLDNPYIYQASKSSWCLYCSYNWRTQTTVQFINIFTSKFFADYSWKIKVVQYTPILHVAHLYVAWLTRFKIFNRYLKAQYLKVLASWQWCQCHIDDVIIKKKLCYILKRLI